MAKSSAATLQKICQDVERYKMLRRHREQSDSHFLSNLNHLQAWQKSRMRSMHVGHFDDRAKLDLMNFILDELYVGLDLRCLGDNIESALSIALKLVSRTSTLTCAFEFNALTAELDDKITEYVFEHLCADQLNDSVYVTANIHLNTRADRARQVELLSELVDGLDKSVQNAFVYGAFKLAKAPAKLAGLHQLYELADRGYSALRSVKKAEQMIASLMHAEFNFYENMFIETDGALFVSKQPVTGFSLVI